MISPRPLVWIFLTVAAWSGLLFHVSEAKNAEHDFIRCVPDMKVLFDPAKPIMTTVNLKGAYDHLDDFLGNPPRLSIADVGKSEVVQAELVGETLRLHWKTIGVSDITIRIENPKTEHALFDRVRLEAWTPNYTTMTFAVLGGLGIMLLGIKFMSDGLQSVAGSRLRNLIATVTDNRFTAVLVGVGVTMLTQSSTVTTVMVVSFINSQIMTFAQGIGVIMGANIGTTATAWLMSLNLVKYGLPVVGIASMFYMFSQVERTRLLAMVAMGLGLVFFGLQMMQQGFMPLRDLPEFTLWLESFSADTYMGIFLCVGAGCILTLIVHSSAAMVGITLSLASIGLISFESAAALVLGENIGTTITAVMASFGTSTNAKRAAYFHLLFNVTGVFWAICLFRVFFIPTVMWIVGTNPETGEILNPKIGVAVTHTIFNTLNTLLFLPLAGLAAKFLIAVIPDSKEKDTEQYLHTTLGKGRLDPPPIAIERSRVEILRMGESCTQLSGKVREILNAETPDQAIVDDAFRQEELLDRLQDEIIAFTTGMLADNVSLDIAETARQQLRMADELESISDYLVTILKSDRKLRKDGLEFPEPQRTDMKELHDAVDTYVSMIVQFYAGRKTNFNDLMSEVNSQGKSLTLKAKTIRNLFMKRMSEEKFDPLVVIAFNTQLNAYRRVREHAQNVAEAIAGVK